MSSPLSLLVVVASPDERSSTARLRLAVADLEHRRDVTVAVWFLRCYEPQQPWPGSRVVDDLRTWWPARLLDLVGVPRVPDALRGVRLRSWIRDVTPDAVILDDGLGDRVLVGPARDAVVVARYNLDPPRFAEWEPPPAANPDVVLVDPASEDETGHEGAIVIESPPVRLHYSESRRVGAAANRSEARRRLDVGWDGPLVVGWGDDGWIDGADVFVRALWALEARHGVVAGGLWLGLGADPHEVDRLATEAERCGVGDRFWLRGADSLATRCCGDAVLLPYRSPTDPADLLDVVASGVTVVTFPGSQLRDPGVVEVPYLDVDAAAAALHDALGADRDEVLATATDRLDLGAWVDRVLAAVRRVRAS